MLNFSAMTVRPTDAAVAAISLIACLQDQESSLRWRWMLRSVLKSSAMLQGSPTGGHLGALSPFAVSELRFTPTPPPVPEGEGHAPADKND